MSLQGVHYAHYFPICYVHMYKKASAFIACVFDIWRVFLLKNKGTEYSGAMRDGGLLLIWREHRRQL